MSSPQPRLLAPLALLLAALAPSVALADEASYREVSAKVDTLARAHPDLIEVETIGRSREDRPIRAVRVSLVPREKAARTPSVLFASAIHGHEGSERIGELVLAQIVARRKEPAIQKLLETRVLWVVPMNNPDGVFRGERKNASEVDLNRNFPYRWKQDWGLGGWQERTNPGPKAFSEPETRAIRDFLREHAEVSVYVDCHRSSRLILLPYGAAKPDRVDPGYLSLWDGLNRAMGGFHRDPQRRRIRDWLRVGSGYAIDWAHRELGVRALVWECPYGEIKAKDGEAYVAGVLFLLESSARGRTRWF